MDVTLLVPLLFLVVLLGATFVSMWRQSRVLPNDIDRVVKSFSFAVDDKRVLEIGFESLESELVAHATSSWPWRIGASFTGIALLATFSLIGWVLAQKLGRTIGAEQIDNALLAEAVTQMGSKFFISAAGVLCTLLHGLVASLLRRNVVVLVREHVEALRREGLMTVAEAEARQRRQEHEFVAAALQRQVTQLEALNEQQQRHWKVAHAGSVEVRDAVQSIDASLQGGLTPLVDNVSKLAENLLSDRAEELLARLDRSFREGLKSGLADVVSPLQDLRQDLQNVSPEQALRDIAQQLHGAITGGASDSTESFRAALEELGRSLPTLLTEMKAAAGAAQHASAEAVAGFQAQLGEQTVKSREANDKLLEAVSMVLQRVDGASSTMQNVVGGIRTDASAVAATLNSERATVEHLLGLVRTAAEQLRTSSSTTEELTTQTRKVVAELADATIELREKAVLERDALRLSDARVQEIRQGREELESAFRRVGQAVADLLARDLAALRKQSDASAAAMDELIKRVDGSIISGLSTQVEDLGNTVTSLERVVRNLEGRTR